MTDFIHIRQRHEIMICLEFGQSTQIKTFTVCRDPLPLIIFLFVIYFIVSMDDDILFCEETKVWKIICSFCYLKFSNIHGPAGDPGLAACHG